MSKAKDRGTFLIKVYSTQGYTAHGKILYAEENKSRNFKNTDEMLAVISQALGKKIYWEKN